MSQQPKSHPWSAPLRSGRNYSPDFVASVLSQIATASSSEVAAACGLTRNAVCGLVDRARRSGAIVVRKHGRAPATVSPIAVTRLVPKASEPKASRAVPALRVVTTQPATKPRSRVPEKPTRIRAVEAFGTGVTIMTVRAFQCRALDDARECCCQPTVAGSSWCAGHRALYVAASRSAA